MRLLTSPKVLTAAAVAALTLTTAVPASALPPDARGHQRTQQMLRGGTARTTPAPTRPAPVYRATPAPAEAGPVPTQITITVPPSSAPRPVYVYGPDGRLYAQYYLPAAPAAPPTSTVFTPSGPANPPSGGGIGD